MPETDTVTHDDDEMITSSTLPTRNGRMKWTHQLYSDHEHCFE